MDFFSLYLYFPLPSLHDSCNKLVYVNNSLSFVCLFSFLSLSFFLSPFLPPLLFSSAWLGGSQLVLETYNVPELSAGVNCTFEDLSEMDGLVIGNQIQCYSPAAKEVPRIITENGEQVIPGGKVG